MTSFQQTRLKLTVWYMVISAFLLAAFTLAAYSSEALAFDRIQAALADPVDRPQLTRVLNIRLNGFEGDFQQRLLEMDAILFVLASMGSYILSGKTLAPIEQMIQDQESFAGEVSHQLRTPLTVIKTEVEAFRRTTPHVSPEVTELTRSILEEIERMRHLVNELLTFVRPVKPLNQQVDAIVVLSEVVEHMNKINPAHPRLILKNNIPSVYINGVSDQIGQIIEILLDNALKYSQETVEIATKETNHELSIIIQDHGRGISASELPHIFDRFYRGQAVNDQEGAGLGLAIAQKLTTAINGKIKVFSQVGKGTMFTIYLPIISS